AAAAARPDGAADGDLPPRGPAVHRHRAADAGVGPRAAARGARLLPGRRAAPVHDDRRPGRARRGPLDRPRPAPDRQPPGPGRRPGRGGPDRRGGGRGGALRDAGRAAPAVLGHRPALPGRPRRSPSARGPGTPPRRNGAPAAAPIAPPRPGTRRRRPPLRRSRAVPGPPNRSPAVPFLTDWTLAARSVRSLPPAVHIPLASVTH